MYWSTMFYPLNSEGRFDNFCALVQTLKCSYTVVKHYCRNFALFRSVLLSSFCMSCRPFMGSSHPGPRKHDCKNTEWRYFRWAYVWAKAVRQRESEAGVYCKENNKIQLFKEWAVVFVMHCTIDTTKIARLWIIVVQQLTGRVNIWKLCDTAL